MNKLAFVVFAIFLSTIPKLTAQIRLDKIGVSSSIDRLISNYQKNPNGRFSDSEISFKSKIGGRLNFVLPGRLGMVTGINLSQKVLTRSDKSTIHQQTKYV